MMSEKEYFRNADLAALDKALAEKFGAEEYATARARSKFKKDITQAIRKRRVDLKMDQKELAAKLHTSQQQLSRYEVGENSPTIERLYDLCEMLDLELVLRDKDDGHEIVNTGGSNL